MKYVFTVVLSVFLLAVLSGCSQPLGPTYKYDFNSDQKDASDYTKEIINQFGKDFLDFTDERDFDFATRNQIGDAPELLEIRDANGIVIWSQGAYAFVRNNSAPDTVNPSLWRNTQLSHYYGLFRVMDGIYQVRGYDITNITFVAGDTGWIVFDPLMSVECARAAWELFNGNAEIRGKYYGTSGTEKQYAVRTEDAEQDFMPITAVVFSHPHGDHFGGVRGIFSDAANQGSYHMNPTPGGIEAYILKYGINIIAPDGFEEHAASENIYVGLAMLRRAEYQYGTTLEPGIKGTLAMGIGMGQSLGTASYISPNVLVGNHESSLNFNNVSSMLYIKDKEVVTIDGVAMEFHMTYGTEAPMEMHTWFPGYKALWIAENCTGTLHNLYTLRGAQVRDGNAWAFYVMEALARYGKQADVILMSHNWPRWGNAEIQDYLLNNAAMYKFINDQTLLYVNMGYTAVEIARMIKLPDHLEKSWYTRQYYGTVSHNSRAVYQRFMGWYDGNPINLNPLTPGESAIKMVVYMGGDTQKILEMAVRDYNRGEYQWVAEITYILIYADPEMNDPNTRKAQLLCADALEQLGYQTESGTWRNAYLTAAQELREEGRITGAKILQSNGDALRIMAPNLMFDLMGIRLDSMEAQKLNNGNDIKIGFIFTDAGVENYLVTVRGGVLLYYRGNNVLQNETPGLTLTLPRAALAMLVNGNDPELTQWKTAIAGGIITATGNQSLIEQLRSCMRFDLTGDFDIVLP